MRHPALVVAILVALIAAACSDSDESSSQVAATPTRVVTPLPEPGNWRVTTGLDIGTLETAWQVGTATQLFPYVEAIISETTGSAFFIFTASRKEIGIALSSRADLGIEAVHLHEYADSGLGNQLVSTRDGANTGRWNLTPGATYVLEVVGPNGLFF